MTSRERMEPSKIIGKQTDYKKPKRLFSPNFNDNLKILNQVSISTTARDNLYPGGGGLTKLTSVSTAASRLKTSINNSMSKVVMLSDKNQIINQK